MQYDRIAMKRVLRIFAALLLLGAVVLWAATGANHGFTRNQTEIKTPDPVTGLDTIQWKKQFVPGVDFLVATGLLSAVLVSASFFFRNKKTGTQSSP
jgi:hypothetical protein